MTTNRSVLIASAAFLLLGLAGQAQAQIKLGTPGSSVAQVPASSDADIVDGRDPSVLASIIRDLGYQAKVTQAKDGSPLIESSASGLSFTIRTYSCTKDSSGCSIDFTTYWLTSKDPMSEKKINEWNRAWRFVKAYNDTDGDLNLTMYLELTGGVKKPNFAKNFERWTSFLTKFDQFRKEK